jgi:hypothetical protein
MPCGKQKTPILPGGKGREDELEESSDQQGVLTGEDQRYILIIRGIEKFLPSNLVEEKLCVAEATKEDRLPAETVMEEEMEQTLMFS